jgi:hypothetical protein
MMPKKKRQFTKDIIRPFLSPTDNDSDILSVLVVNSNQIFLSHRLKSVVGCREIEDRQMFSSPHLQSTLCEMPATSRCQPSKLPVAKQNIKHEG